MPTNPLRVACMAALVLVSSGAAPAQVFRGRMGVATARFIEPPRSIRQAVRRAETAIEEERFAEAIVTLGDIASGQWNDPEFTGQDYVILDDDQNSELHRGSLMRRVRDLIGSLPREGMRLYRLRYNAAAERDLKQAAQTGDLRALADVRRRYFHTDAGYRASAILATDRWLGGHAIETSLLLDDVVNHPHAVDLLGTEIVRLHAAAAATAGRVDRDDGEVVAVKNESEQESEPANPVVAPEFIDDARPVDYRPMPTPSDRYRMFGGVPTRNGLNEGQFPLANLRYDIDTTASPRQAESIRQAAASLRSARRLPPPSWMPLRVADQLLVRTTERLLGVDYRTGKTIWTYPWLSPYEEFDDEISGGNQFGEDDEGSLLTQRIWNDVPYGHLSSDGTAVYMLDNLDRISSPINPMIQMRMRGVSRAGNRGNTLVALELATEGKLLWRIGRDAELDLSSQPSDSPLSDSFFLGPPLPVDGRLYVMVETAGDINLLCLDPANGETIWQQTLVSVESGNVESDRIRRIGGAACSYHEGVLVCPTGAGAVVAMNLLDRTIRWARSYPRNSEPNMSIRLRSSRVIETSTATHWDASMATIEGTKVLLTATESDRLLAIDLITGQPLFSEKPRIKMNYLAGIRDGKFILVGPNQVIAYSTRNGSSLWSIDRDALAPTTQICGRGVFDEDAFYVPTTENEILKISLEDGAVLDRRVVGFPLGNLVCVDGEVISAGPTRLVVAYGNRSLRPIVESRLAANPDDFSALVRKGELMLLDGRRDDALRYLDRARRLQPDDVEVRLLSVQAMLTAMREDPATSAATIETLDRLITDPGRRIEFLGLRLRAAIAEADTDAALTHLFALSDRVLELPIDQTVEPEMLDGENPVEMVLQDEWIAARSMELWDLLKTDEARDALMAEVDRRLTPLLSDASTRLLRRRDHLGPLAAFAVGGRRRVLMHEIMDRWQRGSSLLAVERFVFGRQPLSAESAARLDPDLRKRMAEQYRLGGAMADALRIGDADVGVENGDDIGVNQNDSSGNLEGTSDWPAHVRMTRQTRPVQFSGAEDRLIIGRTRHGYGVATQNMDVVGSEIKPLMVRYAAGDFRGVNLSGLPSDESENRTGIVDGGALVALVGGYIVGCDLYSVDVPGPNLESNWSIPIVPDRTAAYKRRRLNTPFGDVVVNYTFNAATAARGLGEMSIGPIVGDRFYLMRGGRISAIDVRTGLVLWQRTAESSTGQLIADGRYVALVSAESSLVEIFDAADGSIKGVRKWDHGKIWCTAGSNVLAYDKTPKPGIFDVTLVSPLDWMDPRWIEQAAADTVEVDPAAPRSSPGVRLESRVWQAGAEGSPQSGIGRVVSGRYLVMTQSDGETFAWDLLRGKEMFRTQLPAEPMLAGMDVIDYGDRFALLIRRHGESNSDGPEKLQTSQGADHREVSAIRMLDRAGGDLVWQETFDPPWGCSIDQPAGSPVIVLARSFYRFDGNSRPKTLDVLALRVDNGQVAGVVDRLESIDQKDHLVTTVLCNPMRQTVTAEVGSETFVLEFSPTPFEPNDDASKPGGSEKESTDPDKTFESDDVPQPPIPPRE